MATQLNDSARVVEEKSGLPSEDIGGPSTSGISDQNVPALASPTSHDNEQENLEGAEVDSKTGRRRFWGLGKKKEDEKAKKKREAATASGTASQIPLIRPVSPLYSPKMAHISSPHPTSHPYGAPASPGRSIHPSSPHMSSPASSQIFERNVQEDGLHTSASPAIPAHITTENHIPPVLDSASAAITDDHLDPDNVEIVMHSAHQPAAVTVTGTGISEAAGSPWQDDLLAHPDNDDAASNYGALDTADVRRLSFISFADVVLAEHVDHNSHNSGNRDSAHLSGTTGMSSSAAFNRSPSPVRSPASSYGLGGSPPLNGSSSFKGSESASGQGSRLPGNLFTGHSPPSGDLTIETMRQALRKTGSGDLGGARSQPISAIGGDDGTIEHPFK